MEPLSHRIILAQKSNTVPDDFTQARQIIDSLYQRQKTIADKLNAFPTGQFNLTLDSVKNSPEYKELKQESNRVFNAIRDFNSVYVKKFKKELAEDRKNRFPISKNKSYSPFDDPPEYHESFAG